jgi:hypothetical protein
MVVSAKISFNLEIHMFCFPYECPQVMIMDYKYEPLTYGTTTGAARLNIRFNDLAV